MSLDKVFADEAPLEVEDAVTCVGGKIAGVQPHDDIQKLRYLSSPK
jgi:hypothetical protein